LLKNAGIVVLHEDHLQDDLLLVGDHLQDDLLLVGDQDLGQDPQDDDFIINLVDEFLKT
jgi:hypothetical protein